MNKCYSQGSLVCKPALYFANDYVGEGVIAQGSATSHPTPKKQVSHCDNQSTCF